MPQSVFFPIIQNDIFNFPHTTKWALAQTAILSPIVVGSNFKTQALINKCIWYQIKAEE